MNRLKMIGEERKALHRQVMQLMEGEEIGMKFSMDDASKHIKRLYLCALVDALFFSGFTVMFVNCLHSLVKLIGELLRRGNTAV